MPMAMAWVTTSYHAPCNSVGEDDRHLVKPNIEHVAVPLDLLPTTIAAYRYVPLL